jgi:O-antigen ligase
MQKFNEINFSFVFVLLSLIIVLSIVSRFSFLLTIQVAIFSIFLASILFLINNYNSQNSPYIVPALLLVVVSCLSYINADYQINVRDNILVLVSGLMAGFHITFLSIDVRKKLFVVPIFVGLWLSMIILSRFISVPQDFFAGNVSFYEGIALNVNVIAGFLVLVYPLLFLLIRDSEKTISKVFIVMAVVFLLAIFITKARVAIVASLIITLIFLFEHKQKTYAKICISLIVLILVGVIAYVSLLKNYNGNSITERIIWWKTAYLIFKDNMFFGCGLGNFSVLFKAFRPEFVLNTSYAHNIFMQFLADIGIIGLVSFLWLVFVFYKKVLYEVKFGENKYYYKVIFISITFFLLLNLIDYAFFVPANMLVFFVIFCSVFFPKIEKLKKERVNTYLITAIFLVFLFFVIKPVIADRYYKKGIEFYLSKQYKIAIENFDGAIKFDKKNPEYYYQLANVNFAIYDVDRDKGQVYIGSAIQYTKKAIELYKNSSQLKTSLASMYWIIGDKENAMKYIEEARNCDKFNYYISEQLEKIKNS